MGKERQFAILRQGAEVWNAWRERNPYEEIDFRKTCLDGEFLFNVFLAEAHLDGASLIGTILDGACLDGAFLIGARLDRARLKGTSLNGARLNDASLNDASLKGASLDGAFFDRASLDWADLTGASLKNTDMSYARLTGTNFSNANITGTCLYGTARADWKIDGIQCDYVYWDFEAKERTPKDRDFKPGEFEALYKSLPTFEYYFEQGFTPLDPLIMDRVVQAIRERQPEIELTLKNFEVTGTPHATFTVLHKDDKDDALKAVTADYERRLELLEGQKDQLMQVIAMLGSGGITLTGDIHQGVLIQQVQGSVTGDVIGQDKTTTE